MEVDCHKESLSSLSEIQSYIADYLEITSTND